MARGESLNKFLPPVHVRTQSGSTAETAPRTNRAQSATPFQRPELSARIRSQPRFSSAGEKTRGTTVPQVLHYTPASANGIYWFIGHNASIWSCLLSVGVSKCGSKQTENPSNPKVLLLKVPQCQFFCLFLPTAANSREAGRNQQERLNNLTFPECDELPCLAEERESEKHRLTKHPRCKLEQEKMKRVSLSGLHTLLSRSIPVTQRSFP